MPKQNNGGVFLAGLLLGGTVGTIAGLLVAPRSGRDTRRILKKSVEVLPELAEELSHSLQLYAGQLSESAEQRWNDTLDRLKDAIAAGIETSQIEVEEIKQTLDNKVLENETINS
jgi:gas vesicle protein